MDTKAFKGKTYKIKHICFNCRKVFKRRDHSDIYPETAGKTNRIEKEPKCPGCGNSMIATGAKFRTPIKDDKQSWEILKIIYDITPEGHSQEIFGHLYSVTEKFSIPGGKVAMQKLLTEYKITLTQIIERVSKYEYSEQTKDTIRLFSDKLKLLEAYLKK